MKLTEYKITSKTNIKIALLADLHKKPYGNALSLIKEASPDVILSAGDMMDRLVGESIYASENENALILLSECAKLAPVFYSIGNHERGISAKNKKLFSDLGIKALDNEYDSFRDIYIGGLTSGLIYNKNPRTKSSVPKTDFIEKFAKLRGVKILLSHHPEYWERYIKNTDIDITLSGHAHGGQWRFFGRGIYAPGQGLFPKYTDGVTDSRLVISRGMANTVFVPRLFNPCEVVLITLFKV